MKAGKRILAGALCLMMVLGGCTSESANHKKGSVENNKKEDSNQSKLDALQPHAYGNVQGLSLEPGAIISIIGRQEKTAYWTAVKEGAQAAVDAINENLGYKGNDKVTLNYSAPETENDVDGQVNILDEELDRYPVAVGIALADASASQVQFDMAADNGIPVVAFDSGTDYKDVVCMVDTNNIEAAATAAAKLCDAISDSGEILMFVHDSSSTSAKGREEGFVKAIADEHSGVTIANIYHLDELDAMKRQVASEMAQENTEVSEEDEDADVISEIASGLTEADIIQYIFEQHPEARGIYTTSESAAKAVLNVVDAFENKEEYKIVGFDGGEEQLERLEDGRFTGLIVQNPYGIGYATVVACARAAMGEGNEAIVDAGFTWVTAKNLDDEAIQNMMY
ncbi:MAG: substrate-binding domain-containing protein [bacterium]|nr:substrate-binding domain-containing protein [bacterium]